MFNKFNIRNWKRTISCFLILLLGLALPLPVFADVTTEALERRAAAEQQVDQLQEELEEIAERQAQLQDEIQGLDHDLAEAMIELGVLENDLEAQEEEVAAANAALAKAIDAESHHYEEMKKRIQFVYERGEDTIVTTLLQSSNLTEFVSRVEFMTQLYGYDRDLLETYTEAKNNVEEAKGAAEAALAVLQDLKATYEERRAELEAILGEKRNALEEFDEEFEGTAALVEQYKETILEQNRILREEFERRERERLEQERLAREQFGVAVEHIADERVAALLSYALGFVGNPYVWGGTNPYVGADCSGFVQHVYGRFGVSLPRVSQDQMWSGQEVSFLEARPGDLICYGDHIGIYLGGNRIVHASNSQPYPAGGIKTGTATYRTILSIRRVL